MSGPVNGSRQALAQALRAEWEQRGRPLEFGKVGNPVDVLRACAMQRERAGDIQTAAALALGVKALRDNGFDGTEELLLEVGVDLAEFRRRAVVLELPGGRRHLVRPGGEV